MDNISLQSPKSKQTQEEDIDDLMDDVNDNVTARINNLPSQANPGSQYQSIASRVAGSPSMPGRSNVYLSP